MKTPAMLPTVEKAYINPLIRPTWDSLVDAIRIIYGDKIASTKHGIRKKIALPIAGSSFVQIIGIDLSSGWRIIIGSISFCANDGISDVYIPAGINSHAKKAAFLNLSAREPPTK